MCRYSLSFHSTCRHLSWVVAEYCEKAEPAVATASSRLRRTASLQNFANISSQEMPALPQFPAGGFRQWMSGPRPATVNTAEGRETARHREVGIRGSDESGNLHDSEAILQHISQSSRSPDDSYIGTDGRRMTSHGSTTAASDLGASPYAVFDTIEAEIDTIRADVRHMRAEAKREQRTGEQTSTHRQHDLPLRAEGSKIPAPIGTQYAIKTSDSSKRAAGASSDKAPTMAGTMKRSYAQTGTSKIKGVLGMATSSRHSNSNAPSPESATSARSFGAPPKTGQNTPHQAYSDAAEYLQGTPSSDKSSPHFAQPTQAATRRVDQTLHKDTPSVKPSPETSPGKSTKAKAPDFETNKRAVQRQQKRTSLPEGWISTPEQASSAEKSGQKKEQVVPKATASSSSPGGDTSSAGSPTLQKKTSSYMSPTKSAQHRSIATIGQESTRKMSPRLKARGLTINTTLANNTAGFATRSPLGAGRSSDSDDIFFSPKSRFSPKPTSKSESPLKSGALGSSSASSGNERSSSAMRLPLPLPRVANTVMSPREPDHGFLDHIKEKLGNQDLLRRDSAQEQNSLSARRTSRSDILKPVFARLDRRPTTGYANRSSVQSNDSVNQPISQLIMGLRGQTSASIGKALATDQHGSKDATNAKTPVAAQVVDPAIVSQGRKPSSESTLPHVDPAIVYQGRKPSAESTLSHADPAIVYQGRKPSASSDLPQDPAILFSSGPLHLEAPTALEFRKGSQPSSLRATALNFVPGFEPQDEPQPEDSPTCESPLQIGRWRQPRGLSLFDADYETYEDPGMTDEQRISLLPQIPRDRLFDVWDAAAVEAFEAERYPPWPPRNPGGDIPYVDLLHGDLPYDCTPVISPTSSSTSPPGTQQQQSQGAQGVQGSQGQWSISGHGRRRYNWTGSDGLEITFKGVGSDAEHDPNSPVMYRNYRANTKTFHMHAASFPRTQELGSPVPPSAPKLMREYADKMGFSMAPCLDDQWQGKYHSLPAIVPVAGLCSCCKDGDHSLHRIGGGIDLIAQRLFSRA